MLDAITLTIMLLTLTIAFIRGFVKEVFGLFGIVLSFVLTYYNYDFFSGIIGIKSHAVSNLVSSFLIYMIAIIAITVINGWIMYVLRPIRLGAADRILGLMVGAVKGMVFSFLFFLIVQLLYCTFSTEADNSDPNKILPNWVTKSKVYKPFYYANENLDQIIPEYIYHNIRYFGKVLNEAVTIKSEEKDGGDNNLVPEKKPKV